VTDALRRALGDRGAVYDPPSTDSPATFGDPGAEFDALWDTVAWSAQPVSAVIGVGADLADLLHRLSTQDLAALAPGDGRETVLTSPKGRIVHRLWCHHLGGDGILLLGAPGQAAAVIAHLDRYTFAERTGLRDASSDLQAFPVRGPRAARALEAAGLAVPERRGTATADVDGVAVRILGHDLLSGDGFTVLVPSAAGPAWAERLDRAVRDDAGRAAGRAAVEAWRICRAVPGDGSELNADRNPLEAGLWDAVSFSKGCYVGQEVVARLRTYDKVSRSLCVVASTAGPSEPFPAPGAELFRDGRGIGELRSRTAVPGRPGWVGLAYVKRGRADDGDVVRVGTVEGGVEAVVRDPPLDPRSA